MIDRLVADIVEDRPTVPRLIGVDGPSGSGKSTLAHRLLNELTSTHKMAATLIQTDDFVSWSKTNWWPRFESEVIEPLLQGRDAHYQIRDWQGDEFGTSFGPWKTSPAADTIVMEGITCTRRAASERLSFAIWVEAPYELRLRRGLERDGEDHRQLWIDTMREQDAFFAADDTRARADIRISTGATSGYLIAKEPEPVNPRRQRNT
jgi:uridine kinase